MATTGTTRSGCPTVVRVQNEPALAVDPSNPSVVFTGANENLDLEACNSRRPERLPLHPWCRRRRCVRQRRWRRQLDTAHLHRHLGTRVPRGPRSGRHRRRVRARPGRSHRHRAVVRGEWPAQLLRPHRRLRAAPGRERRTARGSPPATRRCGDPGARQPGRSGSASLNSGFRHGVRDADAASVELAIGRRGAESRRDPVVVVPGVGACGTPGRLAADIEAGGVVLQFGCRHSCVRSVRSSSHGHLEYPRLLRSRVMR